MPVFEMILAILLGAVLLAMVARRLAVPYPVLLALMGVGISLIPGLPPLNLPPDLILALLVAPILLDAAHDMSLRDLHRNWLPIFSLVVVAVGLTTIIAAYTARWFLPDMPWGAAIALGALLAPPDAVAAIAVMRQVEPPHRVRMVLEGESLLNDASSLLIYRLAVTTVVSGSMSFRQAAPPFLLVAFGSVFAGWLLAKSVARLIRPIGDAAIATVLQFVTTFGVWIIAERLGLSGVITVVVFGLMAARASTSAMPTLVRVSSFATWETITFVLNVLAFVLVGLQLRGMLSSLEGSHHLLWLVAAAACLVIVILVRFAWVFLYRGMTRESADRPDAMNSNESLKAGLVIGWSGMRGIVTLAAALALPVGFPYRDFILMTAFVVVLGTLLIQGLTLRPLLQWLGLPKDSVVESEVRLARTKALKAALQGLSDKQGEVAERLRREYQTTLAGVKLVTEDGVGEDGMLRREIVRHARSAIDALRDSGQIGDDAFRKVEQELDWLELSIDR